MPAPGRVIEYQLRLWLEAVPGRTARQLADGLSLSRRSVENWLAGRSCSSIVANRVILPWLRRQMKK